MRYLIILTLWLSAIILVSCEKKATSDINDGETLAFPTAKGFGRYSQGGRGGKIIYVTSLEDNKEREEGTLRYALEVAEGPRIVVFKVSGIIELNLDDNEIDDIEISSPYITVAGQTAPGDGITLKNGGIRPYTHDIIIRHIRIRPGDGQNGTLPEVRDAMETWKDENLYNIIFDHVSASWAIDEIFCVRRLNHNITFQNCLISEALFHSLHPEGGHSRAHLIMENVDHITIYNCLYAHNVRRNVHILSGAHSIDFINNVIYNWGKSGEGAGTHLDAGKHQGPHIDVNIVGNYYKLGPDSHDDPLYTRTNFYVEDGSQLYVKGNIVDYGDSIRDAQKSSDRYAEDSMFYKQYLLDTPLHALDNIYLQTAIVAYNKVLSNVGANKPKSDLVDLRVISDVINKTGSIIDSPSEVGGYPVHNSTTPPVDTDSDGMPDNWEDHYGLDQDAADGNNYNINKYYTNIEIYLNQLAGDYD